MLPSAVSRDHYSRFKVMKNGTCPSHVYKKLGEVLVQKGQSIEPIELSLKFYLLHFSFMPLAFYFNSLSPNFLV